VAGSDGADEDRWLHGAAHGVSDGDGVFVDIETDEKWSTLFHG
jgi:hypothetical protein